MSSSEGVVTGQGTGSDRLCEDVDMATSTSASSNLKPRSGKISFSVDSLLSDMKKTAVTGGAFARRENDDRTETEKNLDMEARYRELLMEQQRLQSRELLARLSPHGLAFANHHHHHPSSRMDQDHPSAGRQEILTVKDFSRTTSHDKSSSPIRIDQEVQKDRDERRLSTGSPASRITESMIQRERGQEDDERMDRIANPRSVSPVSRREIMDDRSDSEANRSLEGDRADHLDLEDQEIRSVGQSEDLNVMDSDCELERDLDNNQEKEEKSSPVVPQPIHPGVQRPSQGPPYLTGAPGAPGWNPAGFPHSLAGFAWLPPPPHPHNPHGHLYTPHGGPTSPNVFRIDFRRLEAAGSRTWACQVHPEEAQAKSQTEDTVHHPTAALVGEKVSRKAVPNDRRTSGILVVPSPHGNAGENLVPEQASEGEASPGGRDREAEAVGEAVVAPEFRFWLDVLRSGASRNTRSASLHRGGHG
ncbi:homeobox protein Msx isoform X2 [Osmia lignaria lignaria]|uniref:homeobox protein Msx isoform X2 n=1 Tax=Osmia lignaria lignaria TaxID=1437193 RepID=UPI00402BAE16